MIRRNSRRWFRRNENRFAAGMFDAAGRHQGRGAFMIAAIANVVQPIVQLRRARQRTGQGERNEEQPGQCTTFHGAQSAAPRLRKQTRMARLEIEGHRAVKAASLSELRRADTDAAAVP